MKSMFLPSCILAGVLAQVTLLSTPVAAQEESRRPEPREDREHRESEPRGPGEANDRDHDRDHDRDFDSNRGVPERRHEGEVREREVVIKRDMGDISEGHRRLHHLHVAIENLRAGGFREPAQHLEELAERLRREIHGRGPSGPRAMPGPEPVPGHGMGRGSRPGVEIRREERRMNPGREVGPGVELRELQSDMSEMRRMMEEMRRTMEGLREQSNRKPNGR
jgi:hypothetical protein